MLPLICGSIFGILQKFYKTPVTDLTFPCYKRNNIGKKGEK